jgi:hypothetical protein
MQLFGDAILDVEQKVKKSSKSPAGPVENVKHFKNCLKMKII